jgi:hypothetical protein
MPNYKTGIPRYLQSFNVTLRLDVNEPTVHFCVDQIGKFISKNSVSQQFGLQEIILGIVKQILKLKVHIIMLYSPK